jgi:electron-transferring-flavoprotein dehydrogenase
MIVPSRHQPELPIDRLIVRDAPGDEAIPLDVLFVGAGPAGLAGAIRLAQRIKDHPRLGELEIGVLEKAESLGEHNLSGAVVQPGPFKELFPDVAEDDLPFRGRVAAERVYWLGPRSSRRVPTPAEMRNHGNRVASICEIVRWLGERAEGLGVNVFTGFPADALLADDDKVRGVRTAPAGLDRAGNPGTGYTPAGEITARVTVIADGTRSMLAQAWRGWQRVGSRNPQIYALGVKELWEVKRPLDAVVHTLGWPLPRDAFGGSWAYPLADDLVSLGLVVGLDYKDHSLDVHELTQQLKGHPLFREMLAGGELVEWGAKTIPEGGFWALPERLHGDGVLLAGDAAGLVNVAALKGIHYAVQSGIYAADTIFEALEAQAEGDDGVLPASRLAAYDRRVRESFILEDLRRTRNMRLAFKSGFFVGGAKAWLMSATGGALLGGHIASPADADEERRITPAAETSHDGKLTFSKLDAVFRSGNATRDDVPQHLLVGESVPDEVAEFYEHVCPAGVYERGPDGLVVNAPNCVDCKATDVVGPRWTPREGGSGPKYKRM